MKFSNFEKKMFLAARAEAEKSTFDRFNLGCVITYKGHIIGRGFNSDKSHPMQKKYNNRYRSFNIGDGQCVNHALHAEMSAINSIPFTIGIQIDWSKVKVFVYRISTGKPLGYGMARPCPACMNAIRDLGIRRVYYTDDDGYSYLELN